MITRMPSMPTLLRTSGPSRTDIAMRAFLVNVKQLPIEVLCEVLQCTRPTAKRRRRGKSWRLHELFLVAHALGVTVPDLFTEGGV